MSDSVGFQINSVKQISFALQQNRVAVFRSIVLRDLLEEELRGVRLKIAFEPEFAQDFETAPMDIRPGEALEISPVETALSADFFFGLTEKMQGYARVDAVQTDENGGEVLLARQMVSLELLAYDEWTGADFMPETVCAFVMPNLPAVQGIAAKAGEYLQKWTGDPGFSGYTTKNQNIAKQQVGAVYAALQAENIAFMSTSAAMGQSQHIRTADRILENRNATSLELAVMYASCLESVGLSPLIIITQGSVLLGCWLDNETFSDSLQYDMTAITKRIAINALTVVDVSDLCAGRTVDFNTAEQHAQDKLTDASAFYFAVDVVRTRASGIRPMPARVSENGVFTAVDYGERKKRDITSAPDEIAPFDIVTDGTPAEVTKQMVWERKLLDLSLRNTLLNFRPTATNVQLMTDSLGLLEDEIARGEEFTVMPVPDEIKLEPSDSKIYEIHEQREKVAEIAKNEFKSRRLRSFITDSELEKTMKKLHRLAKVSIEENGANTIYLALGFLKWFETDKSDKARYAPLVLIPVDIIRKNQEKSYSIKVRDEETQVNITMLEMLRQLFGIDIQGLSPIPEDESGIDLPLVFNIIRQGIMAKDRWDIEDHAFIGQFSFSRFIMWNDIRNRADELAQNKVVASLISGKKEWESDDTQMSPLDLDENIHPADIAVPVQADSSQLAAVVASGEGKSFVLHGPPGTGKSQTITNMIANALYHGKSVLFVAEKMAALSVVEKRLNKIGLAPFCLELHSNKAQKRAVLDQLDETLNVGRIKKPEDYSAQAQKLKELRHELNSVMEEIHKKRNYGLSVYDCAVKYEQNRAYEDKLTLSPQQISSMNADTYGAWRELLGSLANVGGRFGEVSSTPLSLCRLNECTPVTRDELEQRLNKIVSDLAPVSQDCTALAQLCGGQNLDFTQFSALAQMSLEAMTEGFILPEILTSNDWEMKKQGAQKVLELGRELSADKAAVLEKFEKTVLGINAAQTLVDWKTAQSKWFLPKAIKSKKIVKSLAVHAKTPGDITKENIASYLEQLSKIGENTQQIKDTPQNITSVFGSLWSGENTDWDMLDKSAGKSMKLRERLNSTDIQPSQKQAFAQALDSNSVQGDRLTADMNALNNDLADLRNNYAFDTDKLMQGENWCESAQAKCEGFIAALPRLKEWTAVSNLCAGLEQRGLENVSAACLNGAVSSGELVKAFDCAFAKAAVNTAIMGSRQLSGFEGTMFEDTVRRLGEVQDNFRKLTVQELAAELSARVPVAGESAKSSELGILQRAIKSGGRMMSIRKLFDSIPNLLRRICPVMLMSPISVAQYIDPSYPKFDLVIFDEASQLPTCEAVGAIARGENVIVVGDPKQMPPTSFFSTNQVDEENYEKEDLESVLDDCLALSLPQRHLLWHYRSRHESLIAYSNSKYYENKLYTFPSPDDRISEVSWVHVEGFYDKGATKTNKFEAKAVVDEIVRRLRDSELRKHSIGVVTFSLPQQNLVDDMLSDAFGEDPELEHIANEMYEPILIKNLENVQGDERDVIFFSIGYGPDKEGKVSMNFGPLNRDGGWRRLNVAISRAREKMVVYSVITPDMIDLSRTRSEGVEGLKGFIEFAAKGRTALPVRAGTRKEGSGFEKIVAAELEARGYRVDTCVGCSDYKIDVAVANPDKEDTYLLGISCCGKDHYENSTAYDRSIAQAGVLKGLGWNTMNVYILDWLDNKAKVIADIESNIAKALENYRDPPQEKAEEKKSAPLQFETEEVKSFSELCDEYVPFTVKSYGSADEFTESSQDKIISCINDVLAAEAPVSRDLLAKNVFACFGISRPGANMKKTFDGSLAAAPHKETAAGEKVFIWLTSQDSESYDKCRAVCSEDIRRDMEDIPPEEIGNGVILIMSREISVSRDDLLRETAHLFGFTRLSASKEAAEALGIRSAKQRGKIAFEEDGRITYVG